LKRDAAARLQLRFLKVLCSLDIHTGASKLNSFGSTTAFTFSIVASSKGSFKYGSSLSIAFLTVSIENLPRKLAPLV
jgi:hypothetical protein